MTFRTRSGEAERKYQSLNSGQLFTLAPQPMDLTKVINGEIQEFPADLYEGHFEKDGQKLGQVVVHIAKVLFSQKLNPYAKVANEYLLFGEYDEYYAAHIIGRKPNYDAIFQVGKPYYLDVPKCRSRDCGTAKKVFLTDEQLPEKIFYNYGEIPTEGKMIGSSNLLQVQSQILKTIYVNEEELAF
ncbi:MAG: hypothetical protein AB7F59_14710 [Bdellovibrionales bacterium]